MGLEKQQLLRCPPTRPIDRTRYRRQRRHHRYPVKNAVFHTRAGRWGTTGLQAINTREELLELTDS